MALPCNEHPRFRCANRAPKHFASQSVCKVPGLSQQKPPRVTQSAEIHARSRRVLGCIRDSAGESGLEQPPSSKALLEEDNITLLRKLGAPCSHLAACTHGLGYYKSQACAFCASFASSSAVACACTHRPGAHESIAGLISLLPPNTLPALHKHSHSC